MPRYDYTCANCGTKERFEKIIDVVVSCECGGTSKRKFSPPVGIIPDYDYIDYNLGHKPVHITSRKQRKKLIEERGLVELG